MSLNNTRVTLAITAYFVSATLSLAWILHRALPPATEAGGQARAWRTLLQDTSLLWEHMLPSELAVFIFLNFFLSALAMAAVLTSMLFLGRLSVTESQRLSHRLVKYAVFKMVFVGSVITPDPRDIAVWLAWFAVVGYLRVFLGAAKDRLESLLSAPGAQLGRHARGVCLLLLVLVHNVAAFIAVLKLLPRQSLARVLLCAFDSAVIAIEGAKTLLRYVVHIADRYMCFRASASAGPAGAIGAATEGFAELPAVPSDAGASGGGWGVGAGAWACKGSFLYHVELVADVLVHAVTLAHYLHVWVLHGLSFHLVDAVLFMDMRAVLLSLLRRLRNHLTYRAATHRINHTFPDVHPAAGGAAADCTICMDEIVHVAKQLPCGHVFHLSCLRAWLQQSGSETFTCPNCRTPILVVAPGGGASGQAGAGGVGGPERRQGLVWWLSRVLDRAYVRLVVLVEPLLLALLLRLTLWLGGHAQNRRRSARSLPSQPREGFGESPGPAPGRRVNAAASFNSEDDAAEDEDEEAEEAHNDCDGAHVSEDSGYDPYSEQFDSHNADSDAEGEGTPVPHGRTRWEGGTRRNMNRGGGAGAGGRTKGGGVPRGGGGEGCEVGLAPERGLDGGWRTMRGTQGGAGPQCRQHHRCFAEPGCPRQPLRQQSRRRASAPLWAGVSEGRADDVGGTAAPEAPAAHIRDRAAAIMAAGSGGNEAGPSSPSGVAAAGGHRSTLRRRPPPPSEDVPSYSGDVLALQAAVAARHIGRTVSVSLRSSWGVGGVCAGAVAGGGPVSDDEGPDREVSSRLRRSRTSRTTRSHRRGD